MIQVFVVGSIHSDSGLANSIELLRILQNLRPQVIFLEIPTLLNEDQRYNGLPKTLESKAAECYTQNSRVELIPVDLPTPDMVFFANNAKLFRRIEEVSHHYRYLMDCHSILTRIHGFRYLNSIECDRFWDNLEDEVEATLKQLGDQRLVDLYDLWKQTVENRDIEMLSNIRKYCTETGCEHGVFLVGASHRRSIREKANNFAEATLETIQWAFVDDDPEQ